MGGQFGTSSKSYHDRTTPKWDPKATIGVGDPGICVGYAISKHRRCTRRVNQADCASARNILHHLQWLNPHDATIRTQLRKLAGYTLCIQNHRMSQVDSVVEKWIREIAKLPQVETEADRIWRKIRVAMSKGQGTDLQDLFRQLKRAEDGGSVPRNFKQEREHEDERAQDRRQEQMRRDRVRREADERKQNEERQQAEQNEKERKDSEQRERARHEAEERRQAEERQRAKEAKRAREKRERQEKERQRREQEETQRKEAEEKRKGETAERNERCRQRAENVRKERERLAREAAEAEKREMEQAWLRYVKAWEPLKQNDTKATLVEYRTIIPWPVKSGKVEDVNDKTVEAFFREATPDHDNTRKMFSLMNMECLKWHTDRIPKLFGSDATDAALSELFKTIVRIVVKLRSEAQENRAR